MICEGERGKARRGKGGERDEMMMILGKKEGTQKLRMGWFHGTAVRLLWRVWHRG